MKKTHLLLVLCLALCLTACGGGAPESAPPEKNSEPVQASEAVQPTGTVETPAPVTETGPALESRYYENGELTLPEPSPAESPAECAGFETVQWGGAAQPLFDENLANFAVQRGVTFLGYMGTAYYTFRDGALSNVSVVYFALPDESDFDIYIAVRNAMAEQYGETQPSSSSADPKELLETGKGAISEHCTVPASDGGEVHLTVVYQPENDRLGGLYDSRVTFNMSYIAP